MREDGQGWGDRADLIGAAVGFVIFAVIGSASYFGSRDGPWGLVWGGMAGWGGGYLCTFVLRCRVERRRAREAARPWDST